MRLTFPINVEVNAVASSSYTLAHIDRRLSVLRAGKVTPESQREIEFLTSLRTRLIQKGGQR